MSWVNKVVVLILIFLAFSCYQVFPTYSSTRPDTLSNQQRFKDLLNVKLTPDVKNIYCFADYLGIDFSVQLAFTCNASTAKRIIEQQNLEVDTITNHDAFGLDNEFSWWNRQKIQLLPLHSWKKEGEYCKYFWYDEKRGKAYYLEFTV